MIEDLMLEAKEALVKGDLVKSIEKFTEVLNEQPDNMIALFSRGIAYLKNKNYQEAIVDCDAYLKANPGNEKVICSRGNAYMALESYEKALADFNRALDLNPHYPTAYFSRSELLHRAGESEQAEEDEMTGNKIQKQLSRAYYESQGFMFDDIQ